MTSPKTHRTGRSLLALLLPLTLLGCHTTLGARTVQPTRANYSEALSQSWNEHLLLNLVRLRYRDTLQFLTIGSVVAQYSYEGSGSAALGFDFDGGSNGATGGGLSYSENPTISYMPLHGEDFVKRMLAPLGPQGLMLLANSGWSIERLMMCCVYRINGVENAPTAAGPTPDYPPDFGEFQRLSNLFRDLQKAGLLKISIVDNQVYAHLARAEDEHWGERITQVRELLGLDAETETLHVVPLYTPSSPQELAMVGRSLLSVFFYLSQGVKPPVEHENAGLVTVTPDERGQPLDWWAVMSDILHIHSSHEAPEAPFASVRYRGYWFYIDDTDLRSKSTFALLTYLFSMQASSGQGGGPLLTLSAGG
jgi:hypothetical protein